LYLRAKSLKHKLFIVGPVVTERNVFLLFGGELNHGHDAPLLVEENERLIIYRVYQNSTAKLQERTPHIERRKQVYDNTGREMHNYSYPTHDSVIKSRIRWVTHAVKVKLSL
jgi:hypothetical protein